MIYLESLMKLKNFLTAEQLMKAFNHLKDSESASKASKFELIKFLKNIVEYEIGKGKGVDPRSDIKNRAYFMLQELLNEEPELLKEEAAMEKRLKDA